MAKYNVTFHHKISPTCKCGHSRSNHAGTGAEFGTGACGGACGCKAFVLRDVQVADLPSATVESSDKRGVAAMLRAGGLLPRGARLNSITRRMEGHEKSLALRQLVCLPADSMWQSIVIEPVTEIVATFATYGWIVDSDHLERPGVPENRAGTLGPGNIDPVIVAWLKSSAEGLHWRAKDADGELYYAGRYVGPDSSQFAPLHDFAMPDAGATTIEYRDPDSETWQEL